MGMKTLDASERDDFDLITGYLGGQAEDFDLLYERYRRPVYAYLNQLLPPASADDLFQLLWLKVLDKLPGYKNRDKFSAWLFRIAHNMVIDQFRREKKFKGDLSLDASADLKELFVFASAPSRDLEMSELEKALELALNELQSEQREVFLLRQNEIGFREIAAMQNCSVNTALARMQYAVKNLQKKLQSWTECGGGV